MLPTEFCWQFGEYSENCNCEWCEHRDECSGFKEYDNDFDTDKITQNDTNN